MIPDPPSAMPPAGEENGLRAGEIAVAAPARADASLVFIGRIRTPFADLAACPHGGDPAGPECRLELDPIWRPALAGLAAGQRIQVLYWLHRARRDLVVQHPHRGGVAGTFALRSPLRPNPIGSSDCAVVRVEPGAVVVRGLDCLDETPLLDIKPDRTLFTPIAPPQPGDFETG